MVLAQRKGHPLIRGVRTSGFGGSAKKKPLHPNHAQPHPPHRVRGLPQRPKKIIRDDKEPLILPHPIKTPQFQEQEQPRVYKRTLSALRRRRHSCGAVATNNKAATYRPPSSVPKRPQRPRTATRGRPARPLSASVVKRRLFVAPSDHPPHQAPSKTPLLLKSKPPPLKKATPDAILQKFPAPGTSLRDFKMMEEIGRGGFSTVFKVKSLRDHGIYVAKKVAVRHLSSKELSQTLSEVYLMREMMHPHIIHMYSAFVEDAYLYIIMEYAESGDLHQLYIKQKEKKRFIAERTLWRMAAHLCKALVYLHHTKNVMHRDVKTLNVFLTKNMTCKLGDLGMSRALKANQQFLQTTVGTPAYLSPEQIRGLPYDRKIDIWGLGILLYSLASLRPPFQADNIMAMSRSIVSDPLSPLPKHYSSSFRQFILSLLSKNPRRRPSAKDCLKAIPSDICAEDNAYHSWPQPALDNTLAAFPDRTPSHSTNLQPFRPKPPRSIKVKQFSFPSS